MPVGVADAWLSRSQLNTTSQLDFSQTTAMIGEGHTQARQTLSRVAEVADIPAGLYGAPPTLTTHPEIHRLANTDP
jgi:hypothetical protein